MSRRPAPRSSVRAALAALLLLPSSGLAHDLWILPGKFRVQVDESTRVFVNNGDVFPESLTLLGEHRVRGVISKNAAGESAIAQFRVDGKSLTFEFHSAAPGSHVIALGTKPRTVRMNGVDFEGYLAEEGLTEIAEMRKELGQSSAPAVERYSKFAKAVVEVGNESSAERAWAETVGQPFENRASRPPQPGPDRRAVPAASSPRGRAARRSERQGGPGFRSRGRDRDGERRAGRVLGYGRGSRALVRESAPRRPRSREIPRSPGRAIGRR